MIGTYLSIDYRDLWRGCRETGDRECAARMLLRVEKEMGEQK